ncbi:ABC transporter permease, partial [Deinococcus sp.]|uniref:ABC transporter permease n=1 Tax=Deinococcus sp. TaxID=47478 RepID=UPI002869A157
AMAISAALGPSLTNVMIAVALVSWPTYARLIRAQVLALREREFVEAARALGAGQSRIAARHLLPNAVAPLLVQGSFDVGSAILTAAGLGFIGFGAQPPTPEWGAMVSETRNYIGPAPWASSAPAVAILLTVLAFNLLGDGLRDVFDPRAAR